MQYEEALQRWGAIKLQQMVDAYKRSEYNWSRNRYQEDAVIVPESVTVVMDFYEGHACCGGSDPDCYCSMAESPRADVRFDGKTNYGDRIQTTISMSEFDFVTVLKELVEVAEGAITG